MKTHLEWYEELPEPYRSQAIANYDEEFAKRFREATSIHDAIYHGFIWLGSLEGAEYWNELHNKLTNPPTIQDIIASVEEKFSNRNILSEDHTAEWDAGMGWFL